MILEGILRRFQPIRVAKGPIDARLTFTESIAVAQVDLAHQEMTRAGRRFAIGYSAAVTGIAPVQAIPTTATHWAIWNADPAKTYFFEELGEILLSGTPGLGGSLWACLFTAPAQVGGSGAGLAVQSLSQGGPASKAIIKSGVTITGPTAPAWFQVAESADAVAAAAFSTGYANGFSKRDLAGAIAISPGMGLGLAVMAPAGTTPLYGPLGRWIELETDME
jgi:hypothetical protein